MRFAIIVVLLAPLLSFGQQSSPRIDSYEDEFVRLKIPVGWDLQPRYENNGDRGVLLTTGAYQLNLRFHTRHASGIMGGRLDEAVDFPWMTHTDDVLTCLVHIHPEPRRIGPEMQFFSVAMDGSDCDTRVDCGFKLRIGQRWIGGYFSPDGRTFFGPQESRAFTLTYNTNDAGELPFPGNAVTERVITEAAAIVNSIHYKASRSTIPQSSTPGH